MVSFSSRACGPRDVETSEVETIEAEEIVGDGEDLDVAEARHMVAGDSNDRFSDAVLDFVAKLEAKT
jgi:hypothetical protein